MTGPKMFTTFYDRLKGIRDFNRKYPDQVVTNEPNMDDCLNPEIQVHLILSINLMMASH